MILNSSKSHEIDPYAIPVNFPGSIWGITTFFNSHSYRNKLINYRKFRKMSLKQGLRLITVELAFGNQAFELSSQDAELLIQVRSNAILWHKERLLNIALMNLPLDCDKVIWIDSDVIFNNDNWIEETAKLLEKYVVVQAFSHCAYLKEKDTKFFLNLEDRETLLPQYMNCLLYGFSFYISQPDVVFSKKMLQKRLLTGLVWAARRKFLEKTLFYDKCILGGADWLETISFYRFREDILSGFINMPLLKKLSLEMKNWSNSVFDSVQESVSFVNGTIFHLFHGNAKNRLYGVRYYFFGKEFNWDKEIVINNYNCWDWKDAKSPVKKIIEQYFWFRNEENQWTKQILFYLYFHNYFLHKFLSQFPKLRMLLKPLIQIYKILRHIKI